MNAQAFYPHRAPIEAYGPDGFRFAGMMHKGSLLILDDGIHRWPPVTLADLTLLDFAPVLARAKPASFLLLGTGNSIARPPKPVRDAFAAAGIAIDFMDTGAAGRTWNVLIAEDRDCLAALLSPC